MPSPLEIFALCSKGAKPQKESYMYKLRKTELIKQSRKRIYVMSTPKTEEWEYANCSKDEENENPVSLQRKSDAFWEELCFYLKTV